jgi:hypothetical protein
MYVTVVPKSRLEEFADNFSFILALPGLFVIFGVIVYVPSQILWGWVQTNSSFFLYYSLALASAASVFFFYIWFIIYLYLDSPGGSWEENKSGQSVTSGAATSLKVDEDSQYTQNALYDRYSIVSVLCMCVYVTPTISFLHRDLMCMFGPYM